jgi:predicted dehydrogenase
LRHPRAAHGKFVTGQEVERLSADTVSCISSRELEDDAMVNFRMDGGVPVGRLWTSSVAIGRQHGLTLQVFGEKGGLRWAQEQPNQLYWMPLNGRLEIIERGEGGLSPEADRTSRVTIGHAEGMPLAFANIYTDLAEAITPSLPSWLGREVTGDPAWSNAMLAMNGRPGDGSP